MADEIQSMIARFVGARPKLAAVNPDIGDVVVSIERSERDPALCNRETAMDAGTDQRGNTVVSIIGTDFIITGHVKCKGQAQIDGEVHGDIECRELVVGPEGRVTGDIKADDVVIHGRVEGSITGARVALRSTASVDGDIFHHGLSIEMGAAFTGLSAKLEKAGARPARGSRKKAPSKAAPRANAKAGIAKSAPGRVDVPALPGSPVAPSAVHCSIDPSAGDASPALS